MSVSDAAAPLRVFLVDDHAVVRAALELLIDGESDLEVVGSADGVERASARLAVVRADVVLVDVHLHDGSGVDLCRSIRNDVHGTSVVVLTGDASDDVLDRCVEAGADAVVLKHVDAERLLDVLRRVGLEGRSATAPAVDAAASTHAESPNRVCMRQPEPVGMFDQLTRQEREVVELLAVGLSNRAIGERLHLAEKTVKNYLTNVFRKMSVSSRTEAAVIAARLAESAGRYEPAPPVGADPVRY
jgi:DNA-binding NarL/FixJ family response regulator